MRNYLFLFYENFFYSLRLPFTIPLYVVYGNHFRWLILDQQLLTGITTRASLPLDTIEHLKSSSVRKLCNSSNCDEFSISRSSFSFSFLIEFYYSTMFIWCAILRFVTLFPYVHTRNGLVASLWYVEYSIRVSWALHRRNNISGNNSACFVS